LWVIALEVIGGLLLLGILIMLVPFDLAWRVEVYGKPKYHLEWTWLFGLLSREIKARRRAPPGKPPPKKAKRANILKRVRTVFRFLRVKGLAKQVLRWLKETRRSFRVRNLEAELEIGLDDPADTACLFLFSGPLNRLLNCIRPYSVKIHPSFVEPAFSGYCRGQIRVYPVLLVPPTLRFVFSLPAFRLIRELVIWRRKK
jgi:hypothetical protein